MQEISRFFSYLLDVAYLMFLLDLSANICHILEQLADLVRVLRPQPAHFQHDTLLILTSGIRKLYKIMWRMNKVSHHNNYYIKSTPVFNTFEIS